MNICSKIFLQFFPIVMFFVYFYRHSKCSHDCRSCKGESFSDTLSNGNRVSIRLERAFAVQYICIQVTVNATLSIQSTSEYFDLDHIGKNAKSNNTIHPQLRL